MAKRKNQAITSNGVTEPDWTMIDYTMKPFKDKKGINRSYNSLLHGGCWFIHYEVADKKIAVEFIKYASQHFDKEGAKKLKVLPDYHFSTVGKYTWMLARGANLDPDIKDRMRGWYDDLLVKAEKLQKEKDAQAQLDSAAEKKKPVISIQQRMKEQMYDLTGIWDEYLDGILHDGKLLSKFEPYNDIRAEKTGVSVKPAHAKIIKEMYAAEYAEAQEVLEWSDPDIKEAYSFLDTVKSRKEYVEFYEKIYTACDTIINEKKATRTPRKPKVVSKLKLVEKLKYQQTESSLGLASINPVGIIDCNTLWVYNTKTRKLGRYVADELRQTLTVKGTTILDFDTTKSVQKTVRKPEILKGSGKLARTKFDKLFSELTTTETKLNGRINDFTILINTF